MPIHKRPTSPDEPEPSLTKRMKRNHISSSNTVVLADPTPHFAQDVLSSANTSKFHAEYIASEPFLHCKMDKLFNEDLLRGVKDEILAELSFTEKETDIYKVNQTGDLASLSYLTEAQITLLPNLLVLRDALYSAKFRKFIQSVTGCGPLSGKKQDMSVNTYTKGCHLLNHDDVIGTRRVSYILYMPLPHYQGWQPEWGGALELYPVKFDSDGILEPECIPSKSIPPSWNQFIFFEVQPGRSFHCVEEVVVGEGDDGRQRLSISGWFHVAQPGEEGFDPNALVADVKSSREQLTSTSTVFKSYADTSDPPLPTDPLSEGHVSFLSEFLNPVYLQPRTMGALASRFIEESSLELHSFLLAALAEKLKTGLAANDVKDGLGPSRTKRIPSHAAGTNAHLNSPHLPWQLKGPPHKWRYCTLTSRAEGGRSAVVPRSADPSVDNIVRTLQEELFPSPAFRAWLAKVSSMLPIRWSAEARRFRPGLDYTLATSEDSEVRLDVVLDLTPEVEVKLDENEVEERTKRGETIDTNGWQSGEWGGWQCYMAPHEEEDDPAVYRSGSRTKSKDASPGASNPNGSQSPNAKANGGESIETDGSDEEDEEDSTLLTVQPGFNRLLLVLRDERVMRFVKYVSAAAEGSRWDICGEYEIGMVEEE